MNRPNVFKVVFIGDSGVGKTSIINAFLHRDITKIESTIGVDFYSIRFDDKELIIWDFAGQEWFRNIIIQFLQGAFVVVMVFDLSRPETLLNLLNNWAKCVEQYGKDAFVIVVGNKSDIKSIDDSMIEDILNQLKERLNVKFYIQTSALTMENIPQIFDAILGTINLFMKLSQTSQIPA